MGGVVSVASRLHDVGLTLQLSRWQMLTKVLIRRRRRRSWWAAG